MQTTNVVHHLTMTNTLEEFKRISIAGPIHDYSVFKEAHENNPGFICNVYTIGDDPKRFLNMRNCGMQEVLVSELKGACLDYCIQRMRGAGTMEMQERGFPYSNEASDDDDNSLENLISGIFYESDEAQIFQKTLQMNVTFVSDSVWLAEAKGLKQIGTCPDEAITRLYIAQSCGSDFPLATVPKNLFTYVEEFRINQIRETHEFHASIRQTSDVQHESKLTQ